MREPYPGRAVRQGDSRRGIVQILQRRLNEIRCGTLTVDGDFGPITLASVKLFQTRRDLTVDGIVGPATWAALFVHPEPVVTEPRNTLLRGVLTVARQQVGVAEQGTNGGPEVAKYLRSVGLDVGFAWCMAFAYWCYEHVAASLRIPNPAVKTASVHRHWEQAEAQFKVPAGEVEILPSPGSIYCIDHGHDRGHCGLVVAVREATIIGIEGNTNAAGSREGDGVYRKTRRREAINLGYLDYSR